MADPTPPPPTFWGRVLAGLKWLGMKLAAPGAVLIVVAVGVLLVSMGVKDLQIGGILAKLLGKKPDGKAIDVANSVPKDRVDDKGQLIKPGQADQKGDVQAVVVPIQNPGLFSNPDTVTFTPPGADKPVEVTLPTGVKAKDVESVVVVQPSTYAVTVKDNSGISAQHIDDLLSKYAQG